MRWGCSAVACSRQTTGQGSIEAVQTRAAKSAQGWGAYVIAVSLNAHIDMSTVFCAVPLQKSSLGVVAPPPGLTKKHLPKHVSWRGTAADNVMKDQATCGSCWVSRLFTFRVRFCSCSCSLHEW